MFCHALPPVRLHGQPTRGSSTRKPPVTQRVTKLRMKSPGGGPFSSPRPEMPPPPNIRHPSRRTQSSQRSPRLSAWPLRAYRPSHECRDEQPRSCRPERRIRASERLCCPFQGLASFVLFGLGLLPKLLVAIVQDGAPDQAGDDLGLQGIQLPGTFPVRRDVAIGP